MAKPYDAGKSPLLEVTSWANVQSGPEGGRQTRRGRSSEPFNPENRRSESGFTSTVVEQLIY